LVPRWDPATSRATSLGGGSRIRVGKDTPTFLELMFGVLGGHTSKRLLEKRRHEWGTIYVWGKKLRNTKREETPESGITEDRFQFTRKGGSAEVGERKEQSINSVKSVLLGRTPKSISAFSLPVARHQRA